MFRRLKNITKNVAEGVFVGTLLCIAHTMRTLHTKYFTRNWILFVVTSIFLLQITKSKKNRQIKLLKIGLTMPRPIYLRPRVESRFELRQRTYGEYYWHSVSCYSNSTYIIPYDD